MSNIIDKKKKEKTGSIDIEDKASNPDNWISFIKSIFITLVYVLILGTLGSNFMYIITQTKISDVLPGSLNNLPYNPPGTKLPKFGSMKGGNGNNLLNKLYPPNQLWFPYSFPYESLEKGTFLFEFTSLFTQSMAFAFANGRNFLSKFLLFFQDLNSQTPYLFYLYPFLTLLLTIVPIIPILGLLMGIFGGFNSELTYALIWLVLCLLTVGIQWGSVIGLMYFYPLIKSDGISYLKNTLREYQHGLLTIWSIFVVISAYSNLGNVVGSASLFVVLLGLFTKYRSSMNNQN